MLAIKRARFVKHDLYSLHHTKFLMRDTRFDLFFRSDGICVLKSIKYDVRTYLVWFMSFVSDSGHPDHQMFGNVCLS